MESITDTTPYYEDSGQLSRLSRVSTSVLIEGKFSYLTVIHEDGLTPISTLRDVMRQPRYNHPC